MIALRPGGDNNKPVTKNIRMETKKRPVSENGPLLQRFHIPQVYADGFGREGNFGMGPVPGESVR